MRSQTGQLARRATNMAAALPINGATPTGGRKTSFRGSTTFTPYLHEEEDSDDSDADEDSGAEEAQQSPARTTKPGFDKEGTGTGRVVVAACLSLLHCLGITVRSVLADSYRLVRN